MKTRNLIAVIVPCLLLFAALFRINHAGTLFQPQVENDFIAQLKKQLAEFTKHTSSERLYVQFDKPFYMPGETIWFSAYLRDGKTLKASSASDIIHAELINPKGAIDRSLNLISQRGKAAGDFHLDENALGGIYKVRAYTNWMKNESDTNYFEKEIQVQQIVLPRLKMNLDFTREAYGAGDDVSATIKISTNENKPLSNHNMRYVITLDGKKFSEGVSVTDESGEDALRFRLPAKLDHADGILNVMIDYEGITESISRSVPIVLNKIKVEFFPEGGDLLYGFENRVAFRAHNEFSKPADVEAVLMNDAGKEITKFSSFHQGMGAFEFTPAAGEKYHVKITRPSGIKETFQLPEGWQRGYLLKIDKPGDNKLSVQVTSTESETLSLVAQVRGEIYYSTVIDVIEGKNQVLIDTDNFPAGVAQITLFDSRGIPRAERLVFVNKNRQLDVTVKTDKEKYLPREKVKLSLEVKDSRGLPLPAQLSVSVVNDQLLSFADDKSGNILSQLLLEQDLKQKVHEASFYFKSGEQKSDKALDYLLMTSGWRQFTWEKIIDGDLPALTHAAERAVISGRILDGSTGKPIEEVEMKSEAFLKSFSIDKEGRFTITGAALYEPLGINISAPGYRQQHHTIYAYNNNYEFRLWNNNNVWRGGRGDVVFDMIPEAEGNVEAVMLDEVRVLEMHVPEKEKKAKADKPVMKRMAEAQAQAAAKDAGNAKAGAKAEEKKNVNVNAARQMFNAGIAADMEEQIIAPRQPVQYYRARKFAVPVYAGTEMPEARSDFRQTVYWNPLIEVDRSGRKTIEFYNNDDVTSFRITAEGISPDGQAGRTEKTFFTQLPFSMTVKVPEGVVTGDMIRIPLTVKNNTSVSIQGLMDIVLPDALQLTGEVSKVHKLNPMESRTIYLSCKVLGKPGDANIEVRFKACGMTDAFSQKIKIVPAGFPVLQSFSGKEIEAEYSFSVANPVDGSMRISFTAYPSVVSDLLKGVESILREPSGCFEQTSMSSYPNAMVLEYLRSTGNDDKKLLASTEKLLDRGYNKLTSFEAKDKGYEWFGASPAHEALTAYGLMQFNDMKRAGGKVDEGMMDRTAAWLMARKDGKGGFMRNARALDSFGGASEDITNSYITYALSEAGFNDIDKETNRSYDEAVESKDAYILALAANTLLNRNDKRAEKILALLYPMQDKNGSWTGKVHSITRSTGSSLTIETTSLVSLAIMKSKAANEAALQNAISFLVSSRNGYGSFGNTQGTILALKALSSYAIYAKKTDEDGTIKIFSGGKLIAEKNYKAGEKEAIEIKELERNFGEGRNTIRVKYAGAKNALPYTLAINYNTWLPQRDERCDVDLNTKLSASKAVMGETVRLSATVKNKKQEGLPSTMVILGIPAGLSAQPWQLKELQEKNQFDFYEIKGNELYIYYRQMKPAEQREINLDLKVEVPGEFTAPASRAYLYYTNEYKCWAEPEKLIVSRKAD